MQESCGLLIDQTEVNRLAGGNIKVYHGLQPFHHRETRVSGKRIQLLLKPVKGAHMDSR